MNEELRILSHEIEAEEEALQETKWNSVQDDLAKVEERLLARSKLLNLPSDSESLSDEEYSRPQNKRIMADDESYSSLNKIANQTSLISPRFRTYPYGNPLPESEKPDSSDRREASSTQIRESQALAEQLSKEIHALRDEVITLKQDKRILLITNQNLQDELYKNENKLSQLERKLIQSQAQVDRNEKLFQGQQNESKDLYEKYHTLNQSYQQLQWKFDLENKEKEDLLIQYQTLQVKYKEYQLIIVDLEKKIQDSLTLLRHNDSKMILEQQRYDIVWQEYKGFIQTIQDKILLPHQNLTKRAKPLLTWDLTTLTIDKIDTIRQTNLSLFGQLYDHFYQFKLLQKEFEDHKQECKARKQQLKQIIRWYEEMVPVDLPQLLSLDESTLQHLLPPEDYVASPKPTSHSKYATASFSTSRRHEKHIHSNKKPTLSSSKLENLLNGFDIKEEQALTSEDEKDLNTSSLPAFSLSNRINRH